MTDPAFLQKLADDFDRMERYGGQVDHPEGTRYVVLSDTLLRQMATAFREIARRLDAAAPNDWD